MTTGRRTHEDDDDAPEHRDHDAPLSDVELRVRALESLLVDKGLVDPAALDAIVDTYETKIGPRNGAKIVARAWVDPAYRQRLLDDGTAGHASNVASTHRQQHQRALVALLDRSDPSRIRRERQRSPLSKRYRVAIIGITHEDRRPRGDTIAPFVEH